MTVEQNPPSPTPDASTPFEADPSGAPRTLGNRFARLVSRVVVRYAGTVAIVGNLLGIAGFHYTVELYKNLRTNIEELLPTQARSVQDLDEVTHRLQSIDSLAVLVFSSHPDASKRFVVDLTRKLDQAPRDVVSHVEYRIDQEIRFFKRRQALFMDLPDLIRVRNYVGERIDYERSLYNPLNIFSGADIPEPKLDFDALRRRYMSAVGSYDRFPEGYYATPDESKRVILIYAPSRSSDIDQTKHLKSLVEKSIRDLDPAKYASDLQIHYTSGLQDTLEEHEALIADLELSTIVVVVLVTLAMLLFYKSLRATIALTGSLFVGTFWTFGLSYFLVGYLNANSAFLGSIVIGNGINFGIIFLARYLEERRNLHNNARAVHIALCQTATPTFTAAMGAGLSYGSLMLTSFRGFNQFGVIGLTGMSLCWISTYTLLPAYLTLWDRWTGFRVKQRRHDRAWIAGSVAVAVDRAPRVIWGLSVIATLAALATFASYAPDRVLETNLSKLRNKESLEHGSVYYSRFVDQIFQRYLSPMAVLPKSHEDALRIAARLRERKQAEGKDSAIANVQTIDDFIPKQQPEKIRVLREIRRMLPPKFVARMSPGDQKLVGGFLTDEALHPLRMKDLPPLLLSKFQEKDGKLGNLVLVEPPLDSHLWSGAKLVGFVRELRDTADSVAPGTPVAGSMTVTADMIEAITRDGPRATLFAFFAVTVLVFVLFRHIATSVQILFALLLGVVWLAGIILGFGLKINFLNFIALPITFGIGVDYGVNIFERYRQEGGGNILRVIRNTGGAVALSSFTTIIGYASLLIAGNQGFVSFGRLAVAGEVTCVIAAVVSLPAFLLTRHRRRIAEHQLAKGASPERAR